MMTKAKFKVLASEQENMKSVTEQRDYVTVDSFEALCEIKGLDPKRASKPKKRSLVPLQMDRISTEYPSKYMVAKWFKLDALPEDEQLSSQKSTIAYIKEMYGISAAVVNGQVVY